MTDDYREVGHFRIYEISDFLDLGKMEDEEDGQVIYRIEIQEKRRDS